MRLTPWRALRLLAVVTVVLGACGDDDGPAAGRRGTDLDVTLVDFGFEGVPAELPAGTVHLRLTNTGRVGHELALVEIGDADLRSFVEDFGPAVSAAGGAFPDHVGAAAVPAVLPAGESTELDFLVSEGRYSLFCTLTGDPDGTPAEGEAEAEGAAHWDRGMIQELTVTAGEVGELAEAASTITAVDYGFDVEVAAGASTFTFVNDGADEDHFGAIAVYPEGTTQEQAEAAFAQQVALADAEVPATDLVVPDAVGFSGIYSAGLGGTSQLSGTTFERGRTYVVACYLSDRAGGPPHAIAYNMFEVFTVG